MMSFNFKYIAAAILLTFLLLFLINIWILAPAPQAEPPGPDAAELQQEIEALQAQLEQAQAELSDTAQLLDKASATIRQMEQEQADDAGGDAEEPEPEAQAQPQAATQGSTAAVTQQAAPTVEASPPPASKPSAPQSSGDYGPKVTHDEATNTTIITFNTSGTIDADPAPDHAAVLSYAKSCADSLGLTYANGPLPAFFPATTINGRSLEEVQNWINQSFSSYKNDGYTHVYAAITTDGFDYLTLYRGG